MESFETSRHPGWELLRPLCAPAEGQAMALSHSHHGPALSPRRLLCHEGGWLFSAGQTVTTTGPSISPCCTAKSGPSGTGCIQVGVRVCLSDSAGPLAQQQAAGTLKAVEPSKAMAWCWRGSLMVRRRPPSHSHSGEHVSPGGNSRTGSPGKGQLHLLPKI